MTYRVTQQDIDAGVVGSRHYCPVARCIQRRHHAVQVGVNIFTVHIGPKCRRLPIRVARWICKYDAGENMTPIRFEL